MRTAISDSELQDLAKDLESDRVERKESAVFKDKIRQAICAFANDLPGHNKPGVLFVGIKDDGSPAGTPITDKLLRELSALRDDGQIQPMPSMIVERKQLLGSEVAVVIVHPSSAPPVSAQGITWIRVGPRRGVASREDERILTEKRRARDLPFDYQPVPSATLADLQLDFFEREYLPKAVAPEILEQNQRSTEERLQALRFMTTDGIPTVAGVLVLGKDPTRFVSGAYIQFLRLEGNVLSDPIRDRKEISGPISDQMRRLDEILDAHNSVATRIADSSLEVREPDYPPVALQQLARNAVLHRNYETTNAPVRVYWFADRIEIHSPGGPYGQVTIRNFGQPGVTDYRNPGLAEAMYRLGYVQRFGVGIQLAQQALSQNGNPPATFEPSETFILAIVRRRP